MLRIQIAFYQGGKVTSTMLYCWVAAVQTKEGEFICTGMSFQKEKIKICIFFLFALTYLYALMFYSFSFLLSLIDWLTHWLTHHQDVMSSGLYSMLHISRSIGRRFRALPFSCLDCLLSFTSFLHSRHYERRHTFTIWCIKLLCCFRHACYGVPCHNFRIMCPSVSKINQNGSKSYDYNLDRMFLNILW